MSKNKKDSGAKQPNENRSTATTDPPPAGASVDQIRDIIFGNQMRDYEKRFVHLEERLMSEIGSLHDETAKRLDAMEQFVKKEFESLGERLAAEQKSRSESARKSSQEVNATIKDLNKEIARLVALQARDVTQLREHILDQSKTLLDEIHQRQKDSATETGRGFAELRNAKLDRAMLAELLMEMAVRMSDELAGKLPKG